MENPSFNSPLAGSSAMATRLYRYKVLLARRWWVLLLAMSVVVCIQVVLLKNEPDSYFSRARMWVSSGSSIPGSSGSAEAGNPNFIPTQIELLRSPKIQSLARTRLQTLKPDLAPTDVRLEVSQSPRTDFIVISASGADPKFIQAYLDAVMEEFLEYRKQSRDDVVNASLGKLTDLLATKDKDLKDALEKLQKFQQDNAVDLLTDFTSGADVQLAKLNSELAARRLDLQVIERLTPDQQVEQVERARSSGGGVVGTNTTPVTAGAPDRTTSGVDYVRIKQQIRDLKNQQAEKAENWKPAHPVLVRLDQDIKRLEAAAAGIREDAALVIARQKADIDAQIKTLEANSGALEKRALDAKQRLNDYQRLKQTVDRKQDDRDYILKLIESATFSIRVSQETVQIEQRASDPLIVQKNLPKALALGALAGLLFGCGILFVLDYLDDRLSTTGELDTRIGQNLLGQIPDQGKAPKNEILKLVAADDERHAFVEAYRNVRSSLLFLDSGEFRPKTFLITSAIPNEGKSTVSSNTALTFANAGNRVLLIDADLRRGELHKLFGLPNDAGLTEVLRKQADLNATIKGTAFANLFLLPRGKSSNSASELFLGQTMEALLLKVQSEYDYVIIDSAPILATDDSATLAPKIDGTLFVVRASFTSARLIRTALEQLDHRGVKILGVVFNRVSQAAPEYHYYKYAEYYSAKSDGETPGEADAEAQEQSDDETAAEQDEATPEQTDEQKPG